MFDESAGIILIVKGSGNRSRKFRMQRTNCLTAYGSKGNETIVGIKERTVVMPQRNLLTLQGMMIGGTEIWMEALTEMSTKTWKRIEKPAENCVGPSLPETIQMPMNNFANWLVYLEILSPVGWVVP